MSALRIDPRDLGLAGLSMSADEFLALGERPERLELVEGVVCMSPSPGARHQAILVYLIEQLASYARKAPGTAVLPDVDWRLSPKKVYAPDLAVYRPKRLTGYPTYLTTPPDLLVEILSPATKAFDLTTKRDDYDRAGVGEFWAIDPVDARIRCYRRQGRGKRPMVEVAVTGARLRSTSLPGFVLDLRPLRSLAERP